MSNDAPGCGCLFDVFGDLVWHLPEALEHWQAWIVLLLWLALGIGLWFLLGHFGVKLYWQIGALVAYLALSLVPLIVYNLHESNRLR